MPRRTVGLACVVLLAAFAAASAQSVPNKKRKDLLRVSFIDVGQGDSIWIQGPIRHDGKDGINILIDGGPVAQDNDETLIHYLESYGFRKGSVVDCVILTHPHDDHSGGLVDVLKNYEVKTMIDAGYPKDERSGTRILPYGQFMNAVGAETGTNYVKLRDRSKFDLTWGYESSPDSVPQFEATIVSAYFDKAQALGGKDNTKENNASTVVRLKFGEVSFLFMGDAEGKDRANKPDTSKYVEKLLVEAHENNPFSRVVTA